MGGHRTHFRADSLSDKLRRCEGVIGEERKSAVAVGRSVSPSLAMQLVFGRGEGLNALGSAHAVSEGRTVQMIALLLRFPIAAEEE